MANHILALETSGPRCGVALLSTTSGIPQILARHHDGVAEHSERLLSMVSELLAEANLNPSQLDTIVYGQGPGGFTGLRVACGVAQGLGFALERPVVAVSTHEALEWSLREQAPGWRLLVQDARMDERYVAIARRQPGHALANWLQAPVLLPADAVLPWWQQWCAERRDESGIEWLIASDMPTETVVGTSDRSDLPLTVWPEPLAPSAAAVAEVGWHRWLAGDAQDPSQARPLYVRDKVAFTTAEREQGAGGNPRASLSLHKTS